MEKYILAGKVVIVTGASDGIGRAVALELGKHGAHVVLAARRERLLEVAAVQIRARGAQALAVATDLCDMGQIARLVTRTVQEFGRIDALINVAAVGWYDWLEEITAAELQQQFQTNLIGPTELIRQVIPIMKRQGSGHIVNVTSYASRIAIPPMTIYASTKYGIEGLSDALRRELSPWGIHVTRVHPWAVETKFNEKAAQHMGLVFPDPADAPIMNLTGVTPEIVAEKIAGVLQRPRHSVYVTRWRFLIDLVMLVNHFLPGIVDFVLRPRVEKMWHDDQAHDLQAHAAGVMTERVELPRR